MKRCINTIVFCFLFTGGVFSDVPEDMKRLLSPEHFRKLEYSGELVGTFKQDVVLRYLPDISIKQKFMAKIREIRPIFGVEVCILHKIEDGKLDSEKNRLKMYNVLRSISTLKGILYYSASRKRMREMFHDAYIINSPEQKKRRDDADVSAIPKREHLFIFQHDSSFGENVFDVNYEYRDDYFFMGMENLTRIWYGIIPLIDPHYLRYLIIVYPRKEYVLFYSVICINAFNLFGIAESKTASFYNRIKALYNWFFREFGRKE